MYKVQQQQKKRKLQFLVSCSLICLIIISQTACSKDKVRTMAKASDQIADACLVTVKGTREFYDKNIINKNNLLATLEGVEEVNKFNKVVNTTLKEIIANGVATEQQVNRVLRSITTLEIFLNNLETYANDLDNARLANLILSFIIGARASIQIIRLNYNQLLLEG